jgi:hypothetical protein
MSRGSKPGERRGGRQRATPNRRTVLADRILVAGSENPTASWRQLLTLLIKDRGLPADIRMAIGRPQRSRASRSQEPGAESHGPAKATAPVTLDVLFDIVQDVAASLSLRRRAASEAALHFLPKNPARGWPGAITDDCGFVISPKMAKEYRDSKLRLRELLENPGSQHTAIAKKRDMLRARIKTILERLESPSPDRYSIMQCLDDRKWLLESAKKRESKVVLTEEDDVEEARRMARTDSLEAGPEVAAKKRFYELKDKERLFRIRGDRLTRKELTDLRLLRLLYPPTQSSLSFGPDDDLGYHYHPFRDEPVAEDGNLYPAKSRLRPTPGSPSDEEIDEIVSIPRYIKGNPNYS